MKTLRNGWLAALTDRRVTSCSRTCRSARTTLIWRKSQRKPLCMSVRRCSEATLKSFYLFRKSRLLGSKCERCQKPARKRGQVSKGALPHGRASDTLRPRFFILVHSGRAAVRNSGGGADCAGHGD